MPLRLAYIPEADLLFGNPTAAATGEHAHDHSLAGMLEHLAAVDLEALAELDVGLVDQLLQMRLALDQWQLPQIVAIEIKQIERDHDDLR